MALKPEEKSTIREIVRAGGNMDDIRVACKTRHDYVPSDTAIKRQAKIIGSDISGRARSRRKGYEFSDSEILTLDKDWKTYEGNPVRAGIRGNFEYEQYVAGWKQLGLKIHEGSAGNVGTRVGRKPVAGLFEAANVAAPNLK
jgi:hypothetical protein